MKIILCIILCFILCISCRINKQNKEIFIQDERVQNGNCLVLNPPMQKGKDNFVNIIDSIWYVPLFTSDSILISRINDIKFFSDYIFVADYKQGCIFVFNGQGDFISKIHDIGEGPNQYKRLCSFDIDILNRKIYVLDGDLGKIFLYDFNCKQEKTVQMPYKSIDHISLYNNECIFLELGFRSFDYSKITSNLILYDLKKDIIKERFFGFYNDMIKYHSRNNTAFSRRNDSLFYWQALGNSIYFCTDSVMKEVVNYDLGKYMINSSIYNYNLTDAKKIILENELAFVDLFYDLNNWYYSRISRINGSAHYFYNKKEQKGFIDLSFLKGNSEEILMPDLYKYSDDILCGSISSENYALLKKDINIDIESNPVLVFYKLKE